MGWIGSQRQLHHVLSTFGAEKDGEGRFLIQGEMPSAFMGIESDDNDVVVSDKVECRIDGRWVSVSYLCRQTSYGFGITVI